MRLWHSRLIPLLDNHRLSDLHMSCCNLRGLGWGKKNKNINYIYDDPLGEEALAVYHYKVLREMEKRGYNFDDKWFAFNYCGKRRQARTVNPAMLKLALWRDVPLQKHTLDFFLNDVQTLKDRGLTIFTDVIVDEDDQGWYNIYIVKTNDKEISYGVRL